MSAVKDKIRYGIQKRVNIVKRQIKDKKERRNKRRAARWEKRLAVIKKKDKEEAEVSAKKRVHESRYGRSEAEPPRQQHHT